MLKLKWNSMKTSIKSLGERWAFSYRVLFFGSDIISKELLIPLHENFKLLPSNDQKIIQELQVVSHHRSFSRGKFPIHEYCQKNQILIHEPLTSKTKDLFQNQWKDFEDQKLKGNSFDLGIVCSFGYMIPDNVIDRIQNGIIIIHPSLLPKYRGAAPIYHALLNDDKVSGVSFIDISRRRFDAGPILFQKSLEIKDSWNYQDLALGLGRLAGKNILNVMKELKTLRQNAVLQEENGKSGARKIKLEETYACWEKDNPQDLRNKFRAFSGSNLHALKTVYQGKIIFIEDLEIASEEEEAALQVYKKPLPGSLFLLKPKKWKNNIYVHCAEGFVKINKWKFPTQMVKENHKFINAYIDKELVYEAVDKLSPYKFTNYDPKIIST